MMLLNNPVAAERVVARWRSTLPDHACRTHFELFAQAMRKAAKEVEAEHPEDARGFHGAAEVFEAAIGAKTA